MWIHKSIFWRIFIKNILVTSLKAKLREKIFYLKQIKLSLFQCLVCFLRGTFEHHWCWSVEHHYFSIWKECSFLSIVYGMLKMTLLILTYLSWVFILCVEAFSKRHFIELLQFAKTKVRDCWNHWIISWFRDLNNCRFFKLKLCQNAAGILCLLHWICSSFDIK